MELNKNAAPSGFLFLFISALWTCFAICYIVSHSCWHGKKLLIAVIGIVFFVSSVMTQIETLFFHSAFTALSQWDIFFIMITGLFPLVVVVPIVAKFFANKNADSSIPALNPINRFILSIFALGLVYVLVYFLFGYFVAWQSDELRIFYTGTTESLGFFGQFEDNWNTNAIIYPFQFIRGILFTVSIVPLLYMMEGHSKRFTISVCLVYLCTAVVLIIPNVLFPDAVRWAHFIELTSSMLLFGLITGFTLSRCSWVPVRS